MGNAKHAKKTNQKAYSFDKKRKLLKLYDSKGKLIGGFMGNIALKKYQQIIELKA